MRFLKFPQKSFSSSTPTYTQIWTLTFFCHRLKSLWNQQRSVLIRVGPEHWPQGRKARPFKAVLVANWFAAVALKGRIHSPRLWLASLSWFQGPKFVFDAICLGWRRQHLENMNNIVNSWVVLEQRCIYDRSKRRFLAFHRGLSRICSSVQSKVVALRSFPSGRKNDLPPVRVTGQLIMVQLPSQKSLE